MSLRHAVLAALIEGGASGYELAKRFDLSVANFWSATPQQLYRDLERLEADGLVEARVVEQQRRPNKRVFTLTDAGRAELHAFTAEPARPPAMRDDLLVKLQSVDLGDAAAVIASLEARLERSREKLAAYERLQTVLLAGRSEDEFLASARRIGPYLTLLGGCAYERANLEWGAEALALLQRRTR